MDKKKFLNSKYTILGIVLFSIFLFFGLLILKDFNKDSFKNYESKTNTGNVKSETSTGVNQKQTLSILKENLKNYDPEEYYMRDEYAMIKMLSEGENKDMLLRLKKGDSKYYIFKKLFKGEDSSFLTESDRNFINCIEDYKNGGKSSSEYLSKINDDWLKGICEGKDIINSDGDNNKELKNAFIYTINSVGKNENNQCGNMGFFDHTLGDFYFVCISVAYNDYSKVDYLMRLYAFSDFQEDVCDYLSKVDNYMYKACKKYPKIWEDRKNN